MNTAARVIYRFSPIVILALNCEKSFKSSCMAGLQHPKQCYTNSSQYLMQFQFQLNANTISKVINKKTFRLIF